MAKSRKRAAYAHRPGTRRAARETEAPPPEVGKRRALRPSWEGHLRLSLVTCPVALYTATESRSEIHFNLINPETNNRIRMQTIDAGTGDVVERRDLVKGYEVAKNKYILFQKDELDAVRLESTRIIDIEEFVDAGTIDRIYWDQPYFLTPAGKTGVEAFAVIQEAMAQENKVALGRLVMHQRERVCALEPRGAGILLTTLRSRDEIRDSSEIFDADLPKPDKSMLEIAKKIIEQQEAKFNPAEFKDRYEDALRELIQRKMKGQPVVTTQEPEEEGKVIDLMEALKKSLKGGGRKRAA
jgi:DNA end-binding protein Ku